VLLGSGLSFWSVLLSCYQSAPTSSKCSRYLTNALSPWKLLPCSNVIRVVNSVNSVLSVPLPCRGRHGGKTNRGLKWPNWTYLIPILFFVFLFFYSYFYQYSRVSHTLPTRYYSTYTHNPTTLPHTTPISYTTDIIPILPHTLQYHYI
jgi:hypothetical protein